MAQNIVEKILFQHIISGKKEAGNEVAIRIDQTLTQDATGTMTYLQLEVLNPEKLAAELAVSYVDHNTTQFGYENFDDHRYLQSIAEKYGIYFSRAGNGICHQVHLERFGVPGKTLLGADSHTTTGGGIGMLALGAGGLDVAVAMARGKFNLIYPKVTRVHFTGKLPPWVAAKDIILNILQILSSKGNVGTVLEYAGPGIKTLTVPERATITNMGAELGVTTSLFPSDQNTKDFLSAQGRGDSWISIQADKNARYDKTIEIDLSKLEPLIAQPHNPDNVVKVSDIEGLKIDQVAIGSCTNSSYQDLMKAVKMLEGRTVDKNVSFVVAPGSKQVLRMIADNGGLSTLIAGGARIAECACGFCIGNSQSPGTDSVSIRTSNRNFLGRSGTKSAKIYLTSVETAVASAIKGRLTDPRNSGIELPEIENLKHFTIDDSMIIAPVKAQASKTEPNFLILRGPNISEPPKNTPLPEKIKGIITIKVGDKITTDHIMPAGDKLKYRSNIPKYSEFVFLPVDEDFSKRAIEYKKKGLSNIIVGGLSYGQGSSREHAAICPMHLGVRAVISKSFERIHIANLINSGILPLNFARDEDYETIEQGDEVEIPDVRKLLELKKDLILFYKTNKTNKTREINLSYSLSDRDISMILAGGKLNFMRGYKPE